MCRSRRSLSLFGNEVADGALAPDPSAGAGAFRSGGRGDQSFADEPIKRSRLIERDEPSDRLTVIGDRYFLAVANDVEVTTEMVSQFSYSGFHQIIMAPSRCNFSP